MKVYKVVTKDFESTFSPFPRRYALNKTTYPESGTKLFAFLDQAEAEDYAMYGDMILEAEAENVDSYVRWLEFSLNFNALIDFFAAPPRNHEDIALLCHRYYRSSVTCSSIRPTRILRRLVV